MKISIPTPPNFSFKRTVFSHGWCDLPPFNIDQRKWVLKRVIDLPTGRAVSVTMREQRNRIAVSAAARIGKRDAAKIIRDVRHMLRLDDDMASFYELVSTEADFKWIADSGAGRLLRSPTVFEDLVKTIATTNCSWALTDKMVNCLVVALGKESDDGSRVSNCGGDGFAYRTVLSRRSPRRISGAVPEGAGRARGVGQAGR